MATHSSVNGQISPTTSTVSKALPSIFSGSSQLRSYSPLSGSPPAFFARQVSNASQSRKPSQLHAPMDSSFLDFSTARTPPFETKEPRSSSSHLVGHLQDRGGGSPLTTMYNAHRDSTRSSNSSPTSSAVSSTVAATPSSHTSLAMDQRTQITLPPLSMLGLKVGDNMDLFPAGKSPPAQPLSYLNPNFNPSATQGKSPCFRYSFRLNGGDYHHALFLLLVYVAHSAAFVHPFTSILHQLILVPMAVSSGSMPAVSKSNIQSINPPYLNNRSDSQSRPMDLDTAQPNTQEDSVHVETRPPRTSQPRIVDSNKPSFKGEYGPSTFHPKPMFKGRYDAHTQSEDDMNAIPTDPLSVLAYAGRMVDRESRGAGQDGTESSSTSQGDGREGRSRVKVAAKGGGFRGR